MGKKLTEADKASRIFRSGRWVTQEQWATRLAWQRANPKCKAAIRAWKEKNKGRERERNRAYQAKRRAADPARELARERRYQGLPEATRPAPAACELCGGPPTGRGGLHLDHCHATGKFRGWLCSKHNTGLGLFQDDPVLLRRAAEYLERGV